MGCYLELFTLCIFAVRCIPEGATGVSHLQHFELFVWLMTTTVYSSVVRYLDVWFLFELECFLHPGDHVTLIIRL